MLGHAIVRLLSAGCKFHGRHSTYAKGAGLVAVHPDKPAADLRDKS
jgi:hypothetical protein